MARRPKNRLFSWVLGSVAIVLVISAFLFFNGYRFGGGFIQGPGVISVLVPEKGSTVFLDDSEKTLTSKDNQSISLSSLSAGSHSILVSKNGFWPWKKDILVSPGVMLTVKPFLINKELSPVLIPGDDPEYYSIEALIKKNTLPTEGPAKTSSDQTIAISLENNVIFAEWLGSSSETPSYFCQAGVCKKQLKVLTSKNTVRSTSFYKDRSDVILVALGDSISAIELDSRGTQNFQPVYKGQSPSFAESLDKKSIFIADYGSLLQIDF